jgi:phosphoribosylanthranilate isomerase
MTGPMIKICGVTTVAALEAAIAARAEYTGFNFFPPSPRFLTPAAAAPLGAMTQRRIRKVGVFVDANDHALGEAIAASGLDAVQLHGSETPERAAQVRSRFGLPVWKVVSVAGAGDVARADAFAGAADFILFDAKTPKDALLPGGLGLAFDWSLLTAYKGPLPWGLAGGLAPENVAQAVRQTGAPLIDVSSGVENAPGIKDAGKIAAFCAAARSA